MTPAIRAAAASGIAYDTVEYEHDPRAESFGLEAAEALGVEPAHVFKTLVAELDDGRLAVALVPVNCTLDLKALAAAAGGKRAAMAQVAVAERATGYVAGGISPLGQRKTLPTIIDESAMQHARVYVSAGRRGLEIALAPSDLVRLTRATVTKIARADAGIR